jgi:Flp pilus assembly protein TadD
MALFLFSAPVFAQANTELPPISPQPPASQPPVSPPLPVSQEQLSPQQPNLYPPPANGSLPPQYSTPQARPQTAAPNPFNFQQFNNAPNFSPLPPQQIPAGANETDPYIRGKLLIRQATDLISGGQLDPAIGLLQKSMEYRKIDPTPQFLLGLINDQKGNTQLALTNYSAAVKKATSLGMDSSQLRINLGNTLVKLNYLKEAEFDYKRAIEIDDKNEIAHLNYGRLLLFKGDYSGAFRQLQRAHELMATDPNLPLYEALALKGMGNIEESRLQLQVFLDRAKGINSDPRVINMAQSLLAGMK